MISPQEVSVCLITKDPTYPQQIVDRLMKFPFGEFLILTHSDSPYRKHELFAKAKHEWLYYQDDDALCPIQELLEQAEPDIITLAMKPGHFESYKNIRMTMGLGWGSVFQKKLLGNLKRYTDVHGEDFLFKRDTEKILTSLCHPQKRLVLPIEDLPSATAEDRLWRQPNHYNYGALCEQRVSDIIRNQNTDSSAMLEADR